MEIPDMLRLILSAVALTLVLAAPSGAAEKVTTVEKATKKLDRFDLWNGCRPMGLFVEGLPDDAGKIGLRKKDIEIAVRARLRGARIYEEINASSHSVLYVNVNVVGRAFKIIVEFNRSVEVLLPSRVKPEGMDPLINYVTTWQSGVTGTHGATAEYILSSVAHYTDEFIDEFLRVNADACRRI